MQSVLETDKTDIRLTGFWAILGQNPKNSLENLVCLSPRTHKFSREFCSSKAFTVLFSLVPSRICSRTEGFYSRAEPRSTRSFSQSVLYSPILLYLLNEVTLRALSVLCGSAREKNDVSLLSVLTVSEKTANALHIGVMSVCQS